MHPHDEKQRKNVELRMVRSDEKPKEQTIKLKQNLAWSPIDEIPKKQTIKLRYNLGWNPYEKKPKEET